MRREIDSVIQDVGKAMEEVNWDDERTYCNFLAQTYYFATHTVRLLASAASKMEPEDRVFQKRFLEHTREETDHDLILIADLKKFGRSLDEFQEYSSTSLMWQSQSYLIDKDPLFFMGYIIALEEVAAKFGEKMFSTIKGSHKKGFQFIKVHSEDDIEHIEHAYKVIDSLDEFRKAQILKNAKQTASAYISMLNDVSQASSKGLVTDLKVA